MRRLTGPERSHTPGDQQGPVAQSDHPDLDTLEVGPARTVVEQWRSKLPLRMRLKTLLAAHKVPRCSSNSQLEYQGKAEGYPHVLGK